MQFRIKEPAQACVSVGISLKLFHERMRHANVDVLKRMIINKSITGLDTDVKFDAFFFEACAYGKQELKSFKPAVPKNLEVGTMVHCDLSGPYKKSVSGGTYFLVLKDDKSEYGWYTF